MQLIAALSDLCKKTPAIIAIDGPAGAGKTTLAGELKRSFSSQQVEVVHLDDLYNGWSNALSEELAQKISALAKDFLSGKDHLLDIYDWGAMAFTSQKVVKSGDILIIEGVGSGQSALREFYSALIWIDIDDDSGLTRVLERDGQSLADEMKKWQVTQREHFEREKTRQSADFELTT